jgi:hypothetical protein
VALTICFSTKKVESKKIYGYRANRFHELSKNYLLHPVPARLQDLVPVSWDFQHSISPKAWLQA